MIFTALKCEVCDSMLKFPSVMTMRERKMPDGWYSLWQGDLQSSEAWHFCSGTCLNQWTDRRMDLKKDMDNVFDKL